MSARCLRKYIYTLCALSFTSAEPPYFCQTPLNKSDCGVPPKPVFSYYLPGSRCEIENWMGCPTANMFKSEAECSTTCIFRSRYSPDESESSNKTTATKDEYSQVINDVDETMECDMELSTDVCSNVTVPVFTHIGNGTCSEVDWNGCESPNKFDNKISCQMKCNPSWQEMADLEDDTLAELAEVLERVKTDDDQSGASHEKDDMYLDEVVLLY